MTHEQAVSMRSADEGDFDVLAELWHESASLPGVGPAIIPPLPDLRKRMSREVADGWHVTVAVLADEIVGFLALKPEIFLLDQLFVRPEVLGVGVGKALFDKAKVAMPSGFTLHTAATNARARAFYERADMTLFKEEAHPRFGHPIVWYRWPRG